MKGDSCAWTITDGNGVTHELGCIVKSIKGPQIIVDGNTYSVKSSHFFINIVDYSVDFPGANCHVVMIGNKARLAVNGIYNDDGTTYEPIANIPTWVWVFVTLSIVGGGFFGGWLLLALGVVFSMQYLSAALQKNAKKVIILFAIFAVLCVIWFVGRIILRLKGVI